jgi:hypothetical protein
MYTLPTDMTTCRFSSRLALLTSLENEEEVPASGQRVA